MTSKRAKAAGVESPLDEPSATLISEAFGCLMRASHRQLGSLLPIFLKECSSTTLRNLLALCTQMQLRRSDETGRRGKAYQYAPVPLLNSFFSFLDLNDLRACETVCASWRAACVDDAAGWRAWLLRSAQNCDWLHELTRHRVRPESLETKSAVRLEQSESEAWQRRQLLSVVSRLPNVQEVELDKKWTRPTVMLTLQPQKIVLSHNTLNSASMHPDLFLNVRSLTVTEYTVPEVRLFNLSHFGMIASLPRLTELNVPMLKSADLGTLSHQAFRSLETCCQSRTDRRVEPSNALDLILQGPRLHTLQLYSKNVSSHVVKQIASRCSSLTTLALPHTTLRADDMELIAQSLLNLSSLRCQTVQSPTEYAEVKHLSRLTCLEKLTISFWSLLGRLHLLPRMHSLRLTEVEIKPSAEQLSAFVALPALTELDCSVPAESVSQLQKVLSSFETVRQINLGGVSALKLKKVTSSGAGN